MADRAIYSYIKGCGCTEATRMGPMQRPVDFFEEEADAVASFLHHIVAQSTHFAVHHGGRHVVSVRVGMLVFSKTGRRTRLDKSH